MSWALKRRILIIGSITLAVLLIGGTWIFLATRQPPSCVDRKQNQQETGVDCGGTCPYLCNASLAPLRTEFARAVSASAGRVDIVAAVANPNQGAAALGAAYTVELYDGANALIASRNGVMNIPPSSEVPLFIPGIASGVAGSLRAFIAFDDTSVRWVRYQDTRVQPRILRSGYVTSPTPRVEATVQNPSASAMADVTVIVTVYDGTDTAIAASSTLIPYITPQGEAPAVFTWPAPWASAPARIEIEPLLPFRPS